MSVNDVTDQSGLPFVTGKILSTELEIFAQEYAKVWHKLGFDKPLLPLNLVPQNNYTPHIEFADGKYRWFVTEYGSCRDYRETTEPKQALEWFAVDIVCYIVNHVEKLGGRGEQWHRRWFQRTVDLLQKLDGQWEDNRKREMDTVMKIYADQRQEVN